MHGQPQILDSIFSLFLEGVAGKPGGGLQGAGGGVPERRLVFARDHDPHALNLQQPGAQVRPTSRVFLSHLGTPVKVFFFGNNNSGSPSARSFSRSPSPPLTPLIQSHSPPRNLVRDGQTSLLRHRLVVSRSTCPPLSPSPHANSFVIGTAVINTHTHA